MLALRVVRDERAHAVRGDAGQRQAERLIELLDLRELIFDEIEKEHVVEDRVRMRRIVAHGARVLEHALDARRPVFGDLDRVEKGWRDRFGPCPPSVRNLLAMAELRVATANAGISVCEIQEDKLNLIVRESYENLGFPNMSEIYDF